MTTSKLIHGLFLFLLFGGVGVLPVLIAVIDNYPWILIGAWSLTWLILILRWIPKIVEREPSHV